MNKNSRVWISAGGMLIALALALNSYSKKKSNSAEVQHSSLTKIVDSSVRDQNAVMESKSGTPADCQDLFDKIETTPNSALVHDLAEGKLSFLPKCREFEPDFLKSLIDTVYSQCGKMPPWNEKQKQNCTGQLMAYRAIRLYQYNKDRGIKDLKNEELVQNIIALLSNGKVVESEAGVKELLANAMELKERWPDSAPAAKTVALAEFLDLNGSFREPASDSMTRVMASIEEARRLDPKDWQTFELEMFMQNQMDPAHTHEKIARFLADNPNNSLAYYYAGWSAWSRSDKAGAIANLDRAIAIDPTSTRYRDTRAKMNTTNPGDAGIFTIQVGIGFDDL